MTAYSHKADVWGVGVVIFVLLTQQYPFLKVTRSHFTTFKLLPTTTNTA
jgi:serine/threonine protein kinase